MNVNTYNQKGNKLKTKTRLPSDVFGIDLNQDLVYQVLNVQRANRRQGTAHAKDRSEKSGGGRKPWAQKGTGRARHGSIRSPIWVGGGVTFGPEKQKNYKRKINKKMKKKAMFMVLSQKQKGGDLTIVNKISLDKPKTKELNKIICNILDSDKKKKNALLVLESKNEKIKRAGSNIPGLKIMEARNLNCLDLLSYKKIILTKNASKVIKETFQL